MLLSSGRRLQLERVLGLAKVAVWKPHNFYPTRELGHLSSLKTLKTVWLLD